MWRVLTAFVLMLGTPTALAVPWSNGLAGVLRDAQGAPVDGAWIEARRMKHGALSPADFEGEPYRSMRTRVDGSWELPGLGAGAWIVTAVASTEARSGAELARLAHPLASPDELPPGVAVTRLTRRFGSTSGRNTEVLDVGIARGSSTTRPMHGRLTGAFEPQRQAYEVRLSPWQPSTAVRTGEHTYTATASGPSTIFSVVPSEDGSFTFGGLDTGDYDILEVVAFPLDAGQPNAVARLFIGQRLKLKDWEAGIELPLKGQHAITLRAVSADGKPLATSFDNRIEFTVLGDGAAGGGWYEERPELHSLLTEGNYLVRASFGEQSSPLTVCRVTAGSEPLELTLVLLPCPPFTVHLVDPKGALPPVIFLKLRTEESAELANPIGVQAVCMDGVVELKHILPGTYDVLFDGDVGESFSRRLELRPDADPIPVSFP